MIEIVKALSHDSKLLIMDEPTAALNDAEIEELFRIIRHLKSEGVGIVYISHRMDEIKKIADRVTVMRDGTYIDTVNAADVELEQIINMMVGRKLDEMPRISGESSPGEIVLEVKNLNRGRAIKNVNFHVRQGEILGFAGLMGAGRTEVARAVFGADPYESGEIYLAGKRVHLKTPQDAVRHGIGYLSEDRKRFGLAVGMDVELNVVLATMNKFLNFLGVVRTKLTRKTTNEYVAALSIKTPGVSQKVKFLSGGNQQKVITRQMDRERFSDPHF